DGACLKKANNTQRQITRTSARTRVQSQRTESRQPGLKWQARNRGARKEDLNACARRLSESRMRANRTSGSPTTFERRHSGLLSAQPCFSLATSSQVVGSRSFGSA